MPSGNIYIAQSRVENMATYSIVRFFQSQGSETIETDLTLEEAQEHCNDPETSSRTCTSDEGTARTEQYGMWFDGYTEE